MESELNNRSPFNKGERKYFSPVMGH